MDTNDARAQQPSEISQRGVEQQSDEQQLSERQVVGRRLRTARETLGLTQDDVAGVMGIPRTSVIAMEAGKRNVTALELRRLARLYRRNVEWLLGEQDEPAARDSALYRATEALSDEDKEQVLRFAQFLASAGPPTAGRKRRAAPAPFGSSSHHPPESKEE